MYTTMTTRDRGDCYGLMEWAQLVLVLSLALPGGYKTAVDLVGLVRYERMTQLVGEMISLSES